MFVSFFPRPRPFPISALVRIALVVGVWYLGARDWGALIGLPTLRKVEGASQRIQEGSMPFSTMEDLGGSLV